MRKKKFHQNEFYYLLTVLGSLINNNSICYNNEAGPPFNYHSVTLIYNSRITMNPPS